MNTIGTLSRFSRTCLLRVTANDIQSGIRDGYAATVLFVEIRQSRQYTSTALRSFAARKFNHLADCLVYVHRLPARRRLPDQVTYPAENVPRSTRILDNKPKHKLDLVDIRRLGIQPPQSSQRVGDRRSDRLADFVGNRSRELPRGRNMVCVSQFRLRLAITSLALPGLFFCMPTLAQVEHKSDASVRARFKARNADQYGYPASIPPKILLLERLRAPRRTKLCQGPLVALAPLLRRQVPSVHPARDQILTFLSNYPKKGAIGLENLALDIPDDDPDAVSVDKAPDLRFAFHQIAIQTGVLQ